MPITPEDRAREKIFWFPDETVCGLGTSIPEPPNALEMIMAAGLDWEVVMRPIQILK